MSKSNGDIISEVIFRESESHRITFLNYTTGNTTDIFNFCDICEFTIRHSILVVKVCEVTVTNTSVIEECMAIFLHFYLVSTDRNFYCEFTICIGKDSIIFVI